MCGIAGFQTTENGIGKKQRGLLIAGLAIQNDSRGGDSYGYAGIGDNDVYTLRKGIGTAGENIKALDCARFLTFLLHTRKATTGAVTKQNAHPFIAGDIIGAHNGMLFGHDRLNIEHKRTCQVDSEHIFKHIAEGKDVGELDAWGAFWYFKKSDPKRVYLLRSNDSDFSIAGIGPQESPKGIVFSSSQRHLETAMKMAGLTYFLYKMPAEQWHYIEDSKLFYTEKQKFGSTKGFSSGTLFTKNYYKDYEDDVYFTQWEKELAQDDEKDISTCESCGEPTLVEELERKGSEMICDDCMEWYEDDVLAKYEKKLKRKKVSND